MERIDVVVGPAEDPTRRVLAALPKDLEGRLVRIEVRLPDELRASLDEKKLEKRLAEAFHYEVRLTSTERARTTTGEFTMDPLRLLSDYVDESLADHPRRDAIKAEALRLLREALA